MTKRRRDITPVPPSSNSISSVTQSVSFSGPLPPPGVLAQYNDVIPNGAERLMVMAEKQSAHRESLEAKVVAANVASQARGSHYAFIICLVTIIGGFVLIGMSKNIYGISAVIASLATLATVFVVAKRDQRKERVEKSTALAERRRR